MAQPQNKEKRQLDSFIDLLSTLLPSPIKSWCGFQKENEYLPYAVCQLKQKGLFRGNHLNIDSHHI